MLIISQSLSSGEIKKLSGEYDQIIGEVAISRESVLFTSGFSGVNNIFSLSKSDGTIKQLTSSKFGAYHPAISPDTKQLVYSDFGFKGYRLVACSMDSLPGKKIIPVPQNEMKIFNFSYFQEEGGPILDKIPDQKLKVEPYGQWKHPGRIHSWLLTPGFYSAGLSLVSDNILNNLHLEAGANYYYNEAAAGYSAKVMYGGLYPVLTAGISRYYRHPSVIDVLNNTETTNPTSIDNQFSIEAAIPLNLTKGEYYRKVDIILGYNLISVKDLSGSSHSTGDISVVSAATGKARFTLARKKAYQNIATSRGLGLELTANRSIAFTYAAQFQAIGDIAIRGISPNHNLLVSAGWKYEQDRNPYHFMDLFLYPRGYSIPRCDWMATIQSSYHFPLLYPDFGLWGLFYCSRVRADIFADFGYASIPAGLYPNSNGIFASVGSELIFDMRWFNLSEVPLGIRFSLLLTGDVDEPARKTMVEFVIPVLRL
jgi:hypothetical protein